VGVWGLAGWFKSFLSRLSGDFRHGIPRLPFTPAVSDAKLPCLSFKKTDYTSAFRRMQNMPIKKDVA
jgi:hypothetical protein